MTITTNPPWGRSMPRMCYKVYKWCKKYAHTVGMVSKESLVYNITHCTWINYYVKIEKQDSRMISIISTKNDTVKVRHVVPWNKPHRFEECAQYEREEPLDMHITTKEPEQSHLYCYVPVYGSEEISKTFISGSYIFPIEDYEYIKQLKEKRIYYDCKGVRFVNPSFIKWVKYENIYTPKD